MEKVAQQELCLLFALIGITGRRCSKLQVSQVAILKHNIYREALWAGENLTIQNYCLITSCPLIPVYFAEALYSDTKQMSHSSNF